MRPFLFALLSLTVCVMAHARPADSAHDAIDALVQKHRKQLSGTLLVRKAGRELEWDLGRANDKTKTPNGHDVIYLIASLSKAFVAAAVLKLIEDGKLHYDDTLSWFLPEYPRQNLTGIAGREVKIRDLLTHTSGIPDAYGTKEIDSKIDKEPLSFAQILSVVKNKPLDFSPGDKYAYSNTGYLILGEVVHRSSGVSYTEFMKQNFFGPLGLRYTSVGPPANPSLPVARPYELSNGTRIDIQDELGVKSLAASEVFADTNIYTSAGDLQKWVDSLSSGLVLKPSSTQAMFTPHVKEYGYGWIIYTDDRGRLAYEHGGWYRGEQSWMRRYPNDDVTLVWLGNQLMDDDQLSTFIEKVGNAAAGSAW